MRFVSEDVDRDHSSPDDLSENYSIHLPLGAGVEVSNPHASSCAANFESVVRSFIESDRRANAVDLDVRWTADGGGRH